jgi:hypothetical protein
MTRFEIAKNLEQLHRNYSKRSVKDELERAKEYVAASQQYLKAVKAHLLKVKRTVIKPIP